MAIERMSQPRVDGADGADGELDALTRSLLDALVAVTGLESAYLTRIDWAADEQHILASRNTGRIVIEEGLRVPWYDAVCRRALRDQRRTTSDVQQTWPDAGAGAELGIRAYVGVPITLADGTIYGTLCGASARALEVDEASMRAFDSFAALLGQQLERERLAQEQARRTREVESRLEERERFLAIAEHEMKTPLSVIVGWSDVLKRSWARLPEMTRRDAIEGIASHAERLKQQVDRMLEEARADMRARELRLIPSDVSEQVAGIVEGFAASHTTHRISFSGSPGVEAPTDADAVYQVVGHLVENAIKYTPEGGRIDVAVRRDGASAVIEVRDEGPGIPDEATLFQPFARGSDVGAGVGLGLHIVRTLVTGMRGRVEAERCPEGGSVFRVVLPGTDPAAG